MNFDKIDHMDMLSGSVPFGMLIVDCDGRIKEISESAKSYFTGIKNPKSLSPCDLWVDFGELKEKEGFFKFAGTGSIHVVSVKKSPSKDFILFFHDATDIKLKLDSLNTSKDRMRAFESISHTGYWEYDIERDQYYLSDELFNIFGVELQNKSYSFSDFKEYYKEEDYENIYRISREAIESCSPYSFEAQIIRPDKSTRYVMAKAEVIKNDKGLPEKVIGVMIDITERRKIENELKQKELRLLKAEEIANLGSYVRDLETGKYECSKGFFNITGIDPKNFTPTYETMQSITHPEDRKKADIFVNDSIEYSSDFNFENRIVRKDGTVRHIRSKGTFIKDSDGKPVKILGTILDITDYKQKETRLLDVQKSLRQAEILASVGSWTRDLDTFLYQCSEGFCEICGLDANTEYFTEPELAATVHPEDSEYVENKLAEKKGENRSYEIEHRVMRPDGTVRYVRSKSIFIYDENNKPARELGTLVDITRYKEESDRLRDAELIAGVGHWEWDVDSNTNIFSEGILRIIGYDPWEKAGNNYMENLFHSDDHKRVKGIIETALKDGKPYSYETRIVRLDGEIRWVLVNGLPVINSRGRVYKTKGTFTDITDTKNYQQKLLQNEIRFKQAEEAAKIGHWEKDVSSDTYICSDGIYSILGIEDRNRLLTFEDQLAAVHPDDVEKLENIINTAKSGKKGYKLQHRIVRPDGQVRYVKTDVTPILDSIGNLTKYSGLVMDITDSVLKERERLKLESRLRNQHKLESIGLLAGGVAHEINNPVNGIMNYSQLILDLENENEDVRIYAAEIIRETERVSKIVSNLLKFSRQGQKTHTWVDFSDVLDKTLSLVNTIFKKDMINIQIDIPPDLPQIECNNQEIQQVLLNLITNARDSLNKKYEGRHENKVISISADVIYKNDESFFEICIADRGMGIDPEIQEQLFDPFFTTKEPGEGTGLGLSISYGIINDHGGVLRFESKKNEYTKFFIELPLKQK